MTSLKPLNVNHKSDSFRWRLPLFQGILPLDKSRLTPDIMAGITLAALGIPEVMGYTKIIGTPVITGLYTILLPMLVFAVFGSSRHLVVGADSATAAIVASALVALAPAASPRYLALTSLVAILAGGMLLVARILRLGFLTDFLSRTVLVGFLSGVGIQVAFGELNGMLGLDKGGHGFLGQLFHTIGHLPQTHLASLWISLAVLAVILGFERVAPHFPGALLAVVGMICASAIFHWSDVGISVIGAVPSGLPRLGFPEISWSDVRELLPIAASCFIIILTQSAATSRAYALRYREQFSENLDLVGLCLANAAAGCSSTFVVNGSPTKTAMVDTAGGRSQISHLTTATMVLIVLLFLTKPLSFLPNAVLSSIVFLIGVKLVDVSGLREIQRKKPKEFAIALVTAGTVLLVGVKEGILLAMTLSLLRFVRHGYRPHTAVILHDATDRWRMEPVSPGKFIEPGLVMYWFGADLFYANAAHFAEQARLLVDESPNHVTWLVVDASAITGIDFSAGGVLKELHQDLAKRGVVLALSRVGPSLLEDLDRMDLTGLFGTEHIFETRHAALSHFEALQPGR